MTDAMMTASNVAEADYSEFAMGTTYALGDCCIVATGLETLTLDVAPTPAPQWPWFQDRLALLGSSRDHRLSLLKRSKSFQ